MATKDTFEEISWKIYGEVVVKDCYLMKNYKSDFFDVIVDIGANVGIFSLYAHMRHPLAKIYAYEPFQDTYEYLKNYLYQKTFTKNIICIQKALGDGSVFYGGDEGYGACNLFFSEEENPQNKDYCAESITLTQMFKENKIDTNKKYYIKIDCEGGERFLLNDVGAIDIIKKSSGMGLEIHFPPEGNKKRQISVDRFGSFPNWKTYNEWINDNFASTHKIIYHKSSKSRGAGVYVLLKFV